MVSMAAINPFEACWTAIELVYCWFATIELIQVPNPPLKLHMALVLKEMPVQVLIMVPLPPLPYLPSHEEQFLPRLSIHVS